jgi:hypothetical protein
MGSEQYSDLVLYRRGGFNFINSYSPVGTKGQDYLIGDGIVYTLGSSISWGNASPYPLSKWDGYSDPNYPSYYKFIGYQDGSFFENQDQQYCRKIKVSYQTPNSFSYINFYLNIKNIGEASTNSDGLFPEQFKTNGQFYTQIYAWRDGYARNQGDYLGYYGFYIYNDSADFFDWFPKKSFTGWFPEQGYYQTYPHNSSTPVFYLWSKVDYTITSITENRIYLNYNITPYEKPAKIVSGQIEPDWYPSDDDSSLINYPRQPMPGGQGSGYYITKCFAKNYNQDVYFYQKKGTLNVYFGYGVTDYSPFVWLDGKSGYWAKTYGDPINSSFVDFIPNNISYGQRFDIYLRFQGDSHQPEYDISNNTYTDNVVEDVPVNSLAFGYSIKPYNFNDTLIPMNFGAFTWPNNETLFGKWKQKLELKLYANLNGVCTPKCIYGQKIYKFKIKWQTGNLTDVYKSPIPSNPYASPSGTLRPIMRPNFTWSGYEEQIVDNIELDFEENNPYAVWDQIIECEVGQAKRLVDVCVLEIRDKT